MISEKKPTNSPVNMMPKTPSVKAATVIKSAATRIVPKIPVSSVGIVSQIQAPVPVSLAFADTAKVTKRYKTAMPKATV